MKKCKECKADKDKSEFYGLQGECKECTKKRVRIREENLRKNPEWLKKEHERQREKYHRLNYKEKHNPSPEAKKLAMQKQREKFPEKYKAKSLTSHMKPKIKDNQLHHWSYNLEHAKDIIELSILDHAKIHRFIKYDKNTFMYKDLNGNLLDTKEKHLELIQKILLNF